MNHDNTISIETECNEANQCKQTAISQKHIIAFLLLIIVMMSGLMLLQNQKAKLKEHEAYVLSVLIDLQEDHLFLKYGVRPNEIGLEDLRSEWVDNPCYETAINYSDALSLVIESFEGSKDSEEPPLVTGFLKV